MVDLAQRLTLRHLRLVVTILNEGNLIRAANALNMTQSAVTKALQDAEAQMGVTLFDRTNRGVVATRFGEALAAHARLILAQVEQAEMRLANLRDGSEGQVRIGTLLAGSAGLLPEAIARLRQARPGIVVRVEEGTNDILMPALRAGELDMVLGRLPEFRAREGLRQDYLMDDFAQIVARSDHPLVGQSNLTLADLHGQDWILPDVTTSLRRQIEMAFRSETLEPPRHSVETVSFLTSRRLLQLTDYIAVWPIQLVRQELATGTIAALDVPLPTTTRPIGISTRIDDLMSPAAGSLFTSLQEVAEAYGNSGDAQRMNFKDR